MGAADSGPNPAVIPVQSAARENTAFRTVLWTGSHLQLTVMSIPVGLDIGLENHPELDQLIRVEQGRGVVRMGRSQDRLEFQRQVSAGDGILVPAGTWHNVSNLGGQPLQLSSIYAPPQHPRGAVHRTKEDAMAAEESEQNAGV